MFTKFTKSLRQRQTDAEQKLWHLLRNRQLKGYKFRRQHPIGDCIADFVCIGRKLVIDLDGGIHITRTAKDAAKARYLQDIGFKVLRYKNEETLTHMNDVLTDIAKNLATRTPHSNLSPEEGERKK